MTRSTHTYALLSVSRTAFDEIKGKLEAAGYQHAIDGGELNMHGLGLMTTEPVPGQRVINIMDLPPGPEVELIGQDIAEVVKDEVYPNRFSTIPWTGERMYVPKFRPAPHRDQSPPELPTDLLIGPECKAASPRSEWTETETYCEDCGDHSAMRCPKCEEDIDLVYNTLGIQGAAA